MNNLVYNPWDQVFESDESVRLDLEIQDLTNKRDWIDAEIKALEIQLKGQRLLDKIKASKGF